MFSVDVDVALLNIIIFMGQGLLEGFYDGLSTK